MNTHSHATPKVFMFRCEWVFTLDKNQRSRCIRIGVHDGCEYALVNFPQGANAEPLIQVISWVPTSTCSKADNNNPQPGDCAAKHLFLEAGASGAGAVCNGSGGLFCAVTNDENGLYDPTDSPWAYIPKAGPAGSFPYESIFEGGINLSQLFPDSDGCFSSFLAETRSSSSFTASLKDFVLDSFPLCSIEVSKVCSNPVLNVDDTITYDITGTVTNTGPGTVYNIVAYTADHEHPYCSIVNTSLVHALGFVILPLSVHDQSNLTVFFA